MDRRADESSAGAAGHAESVVGGRLCWVANEELRQCLSDQRKRQLQRDCASCDLYLRFVRENESGDALSICGSD
jgi:hypothetical protein